MGAPLSYYSAFPFENCLASIKKLVRTPVKPLAQVVARYSELEGGHGLIVKHRALFSVCDVKKAAYVAEKGTLYYKTIRYKGLLSRVKNRITSYG